MVAPFAVLLGIFNPLLDRGVMLHLGPLAISGGWLSFTSLLIRFSLTVGTALVLIGMTNFNGLCLALERLRVPRLFVTQLLFLYRYLFVLVDEAHRMTRARELRTFAHRHPDLKIFGSMIGHLLLKAADRAERIHLAMRCRGFDGHFRMLTAPAFGAKDALFVLGWSFFFLLCRLYNVPDLLGGAALEVMG
ncbi:MAG: energy-coupling factor transporter transmembrane component T family protein [Desulfobulbaceae bacterium]